MARQNKAQKSSKDKSSWTENAAVTDVPEVENTSEFHVQMNEKPPLASKNNKRLMAGLALAVALAVVAILVISLTHQNPVE